MTFFKNIFSRKHKTGLPSANEDTNKAIEALVTEDTMTNRRALYTALMSSVLYIPSDGESSEEDEDLSLPGIQIDTGELALFAFTGGDALELFDPEPKSLLVFAPEKFFQIALENNAAEIHINPDGPAGRVLYRSEFLYLAEGAIPDEEGNIEYPEGMDMQMGVPEPSETGSIVGCLRQAAQETEFVDELYLASIVVNDGHPRLMAAVRLVPELTEDEIEVAQGELAERMNAVLEDPLDVTTIHDHDVLETFRDNSLLVFRR